jgi:catechol 2,3-dioxygenase-like lactoylglutathione lyase family enzyme
MSSVCVIGIYVNDIDKAVEFYCEKLGFKEVERYDNDCIVRLDNAGPPVILEKVDNPSSAKFPGHSQVVLGIETDDIDAKFRELKSKGVEFVQKEPEMFVAGRFMAMRDPAGNYLELIQFHQE